MKKNKYARFVHCLYLTDELADKLKSYDNKSKVIRTALYKHFAPKNNTELIKEIDENIIKAEECLKKLRFLLGGIL